ncbi:hypothetical protein [Streptomyces sp. NPDC005731]|uniref:hypothetical protein n=1 Tax=unclassified Streptomyces TaxID=2593676 RepID=UPI0033DCB35E
MSHILVTGGGADDGFSGSGTPEAVDRRVVAGDRTRLRRDRTALCAVAPDARIAWEVAVNRVAGGVGHGQ